MTSSKVILFDCMDTLVADPFWTVWPSFFGQPLEQLFREVRRDAWPDFEKGLIDEQTFFDTAFVDGRPIDAGALKARLFEHYAYLGGIEQLLRDLKDAGVEMHVLSNYPVWYRMIEDKLGVSRYLPWTFVSTHTGQRKPDAAAYTHVVDALGRDPGDLVFVDDRSSNIESAEAVGLIGHTYTDTETLRKHLGELGVL